MELFNIQTTTFALIKNPYFLISPAASGIPTAAMIYRRLLYDSKQVKGIFRNEFVVVIS